MRFLTFVLTWLLLAAPALAIDYCRTMGFYVKDHPDLIWSVTDNLISSPQELGYRWSHSFNENGGYSVPFAAIRVITTSEGTYFFLMDEWGSLKTALFLETREDA